ncbi:MAG TPA: hypothetical protein VGS17_07695 [Candidatus Limnocylindria bacterium]|nr:hypothetical protein [Candidatus Limnocylindria bacterium]
MRPVALAVLALAFAILALATPAQAGGCINESKPIEGTSPDVRIDKCQFMAGVLRVTVGTTVRWTNDDVFPHEISGIGWGRTQSTLTTGGVYAHTFTEVGIFPYTCPLHPGMSAVVFVGGISAPASQQNTIATRIDTAPQGPAPKSQDGPWSALALVGIAVAGVAGFTAGHRTRAS